MKFYRMLICAGLAAGIAGCSDIEINAPILDTVGLTSKSKKEREPDLPDRAPLVLPPAAADLPSPGERTQVAANGGWVNDPDQAAKQKVKDDEAARQAYCRDGEWRRVKDGGIDGWNKSVGREQRCQTALGESLNQSFKREDGDVNQK